MKSSRTPPKEEIAKAEAVPPPKPVAPQPPRKVRRKKKAGRR
jgi:hypothetical protein